MSYQWDLVDSKRLEGYQMPHGGNSSTYEEAKKTAELALREYVDPLAYVMISKEQQEELTK